MGITTVEGLRSAKYGRRVVSGGMACVFSAVFLVLGTTGCEVQPPVEEQALVLVTLEQEVKTKNGISLNGISLNGISLNGISLNGLSTQHLGSADFSTWFNQNPTGHDVLMRYLVRCAVAEGESRTFVNAATGTSYTWPGLLGLAPAWSGGTPATVTEQQVISACLAAHANSYGFQVPLSVQGRKADGVPIPLSAGELDAYGRKEACFFGNIFTDEGLYAGNDRNGLGVEESSGRPCGLTARGALSNTLCPAVKRVGQCENVCTLDATGTFYESCTKGGVTYKPLTTRIQPQTVNVCGDGVCQQGESCGLSITADSCMLDCGMCNP
jgi:hypothetical protein